jgi:RHS repeat-associated protein
LHDLLFELDHLGSTRMVTDGTTELPVPYGRHDYLPFGYEVPAGIGGRSNGIWVGSGTDSLTAKYTGVERDTETGFDFMQARYHASIQGRFTSPAPGSAGASIGNPQGWNGYSYALKNSFPAASSKVLITKQKSP